MIRFSVFLCVSLLLGITAKPYKPWNNIPGVAVQDNIMSKDDNGKMTWRVEVEPPENIADTVYDIDPSMKIWKNMAEMDKDEVYHPSVKDLVRAKVQNLDWPSAAETKTAPLKEEMKSYREPEEDRDHIDHPVFINTEQDSGEVSHKASVEAAKHNAGAERRAVYSEAEKDQDHLYHHDRQLHLQPAPPVQMEPLRNEARTHFEPEVDMDALYHRAVPALIPHQDNTKANAPAFLPSQRKHTEPEEDGDHLYHH